MFEITIRVKNCNFLKFSRLRQEKKYSLEAKIFKIYLLHLTLCIVFILNKSDILNNIFFTSCGFFFKEYKRKSNFIPKLDFNFNFFPVLRFVMQCMFFLTYFLSKFMRQWYTKTLNKIYFFWGLGVVISLLLLLTDNSELT